MPGALSSYPCDLQHGIASHVLRLLDLGLYQMLWAFPILFEALDFYFPGFTCLLVPRSGSFRYLPYVFCYLIINKSLLLLPIPLCDLPFAHFLKLVSHKLNKVGIIYQFRGCASVTGCLLSDFLLLFWKKPTGSV